MSENTLEVDAGTNQSVQVQQNNSTDEIELSGTIQAKQIQQNYNSAVTTQGDTKDAEFGALVPSGTIIMWTNCKQANVTVPAGWALCNGQQVTFADGTTVTTPNTMGKFVMGKNETYTSNIKTNHDHFLTVNDAPSIPGETNSGSFIISVGETTNPSPPSYALYYIMKL